MIIPAAAASSSSKKNKIQKMKKIKIVKSASYQTQKILWLTDHEWREAKGD